MRFRFNIRLIALIAGLLLCWQPGRVEAGGRLHTLSYRGGKQGTVLFDHQLHASQGFRCLDCHTDFAGTGKILFTTRKQGLINYADHTKDTKCFACHNGEGPTADRNSSLNKGKGAFYDCKRCHRKFGGL
jgi:hypothetical protein